MTRNDTIKYSDFTPFVDHHPPIVPIADDRFNNGVLSELAALFELVKWWRNHGGDQGELPNVTTTTGLLNYYRKSLSMTTADDLRVQFERFHETNDRIYFRLHRVYLVCTKIGDMWHLCPSFASGPMEQSELIWMMRLMTIIVEPFQPED